MSFKVKATVIAFLGDARKYPCHFQHQIGDEFIYDGEKFIGRICPSMAPHIIPQSMNSARTRLKISTRPRVRS